MTEQTLKPATNCWTIYTSDDPNQPHLAEIGRPQDWGDPKWMYRVYVIEAMGYRNTVHCWLDQQVQEYKHLEMFAGCVATILLPGWKPELSGRDFLAEDDFWEEAWGPMPEHYEEEEEYDG